jgi:hypothetical protein
LKNSYSEDYRNECEARELLTWPLAKRRKQLALVLEKRGWEATLKLKDEMERLWKINQNKQQNLSLNTQSNTQKPTQGELL